MRLQHWSSTSTRKIVTLHFNALHHSYTQDFADYLQPFPTTTTKSSAAMGRAQVPNLHPGMASNPYRSMKEQVPLKTLCELCDRTINTRDWPMHKNSKAHRALEQAEMHKENAKASDNNVTDTWGAEASSFTPDSDFNLASTNSGNDGWGASDGSNNTFGTSSYGNKTGGGGGDRACFGCGEVGHTKRDCPKGGASGDRACFGCGEVGHTKRDCPKGGSGGGGQACFNCGNEGYVLVLRLTDHY